MTPEARRGQPAPLMFHLSAALATYQAALVAAPAMNRADFPWHPDIAPPEARPPDRVELVREIAARLERIETGIDRWRRADPPPPRPIRPVIWQAGSTRLLEWGGAGGGVPVLVVPSLINSARILDLHARVSFLDALADAGLAPVLLDWGAPSAEEQQFDLEAYVVQRLLPALSFLEGRSGRRPALLGYCLGGALAAILAAQVMPPRKLVTIGAPWCCAAPDGMAGALRTAVRASGAEGARRYIAALAAVFGTVPGAFFQGLFALLDPLQVARKFRRFGEVDLTGPRAELFVAIEDWLAEAVPVSGPAAMTILVDWQVENRLAEGRWRCLGRPVRAADIRCPTLVITGQRDTIAAPTGAGVLARDVPGARHLTPDLGHVGMIVSRAAPAAVIRPVVDFVTSLD